jgi:PAS domain S-box-containing protein
MTANPAIHESSNPALDRSVELLQKVAAAWCALAGFLVLVVGWGFGVNALKSIPPGSPYMRVNTAIGLLLLGAALGCRRRWPHFAAVTGGFVALLGILTVIEYAFGVNLHIDRLAMRDGSPTVAGWPHGRMAITTAVCLSLLGSGLALTGRRRAIAATQWLALPAAGLSMVALIGRLYGVTYVHGMASCMYMAAHTPLSLFVASMALLSAHTRHGMMRHIASRGPGGEVARWLLPAAFLIPTLLGWFPWEGQQLGYYDTAFGFALFSAANVIVFAVLILFEARMLNRSDDLRAKAERALRASEEGFQTLLEAIPSAVIVTDRDGRMVLVNRQAEALFAYSREELYGEPIGKLVRHEAVAGHPDSPAFASEPRKGPSCSRLLDVRGLRKDGMDFCAEIGLNSIRTPEGVRVVCAVRDLTASKHAEAALRESEASFRQLADAMPQIVWTASPDGSVVYHNQRWCDYTGMTVEQGRDWGWRRFVHPDDARDSLERRARAFASGELYEVEYRLLRADGAYRWHLGRAVPICGPQGRIVRWFGTCTDIDDHKRAEQEIRGAWCEIKGLNETLEQSVRERTLQLRQSEEQFRNLVEGVKDYAILMLDPQGCVTSWTDAAGRIKGYVGAEILGQNFSRFYTAQDRAGGHPEAVLRAAALTGAFEEQGWRIRKDGSRFWAEVSVTAMRDEAGRLRGYSEITRDITERKESEEKIRQSEETFRALLESAPDAMVIADGQGTIALVNARAESLFGYGRQEMVGQSIRMLIPSSVQGMRKNGEEFPVEVSLGPIRTVDGPRVATAIRDISARKLAEQQLVMARQRAEDANRAKSEFLAAMSHEIRTPMNAILGMSDLLNETNLTDEQRQFVQVFRRAGSSLLNLIDDILDFSKIEAGHLELEHTGFQLRELVAQTVELIAPKAHAKGIALLSRLGPNVPNYVAGDPNRLGQVLINLLGNAIKFTDTGEVVLGVQELPGGPPGHLEFLVSDTGVGIPEGQLETIFEAFKQGDCSTTRKYGGSGLGLAISRRIVERMGGTLSVAAEVGKGSTFRFSVPLQASPERREGPLVAVPDFHGQCVAIVGGNSANRRDLRETLGGWGFETEEFASCEDALAGLAGMPPGKCLYSFIVVDGGLSPANGFETAARFRTIFPDLPVVMQSSDDRPGDEARCREAGFSGYAVRPVSRASLHQLVCEALACSRNEVAGPAGKRELGGASGLARGESLRILVAEDSPDNRLLVELYLEGGPHSLTFVEHGGEAVDRAASAEFDMILMDLQMPVMDGLTATRSIRAMEREKGTGPVPILALSANARAEDMERSLAAGCTAHLSKPISKQRLLAALDEYGKAPRAGTLAA